MCLKQLVKACNIRLSNPCVSGMRVSDMHLAAAQPLDGYTAADRLPRHPATHQQPATTHKNVSRHRFQPSISATACHPLPTACTSAKRNNDETWTMDGDGG